METVGGFLLIGAGLIGLLCANLPGDAYASLRDTVVGPHALHLDLSGEQLVWLHAQHSTGLAAGHFLHCE